MVELYYVHLTLRMYVQCVNYSVRAATVRGSNAPNLTTWSLQVIHNITTGKSREGNENGNKPIHSNWHFIGSSSWGYSWASFQQLTMLSLILIVCTVANLEAEVLDHGEYCIWMPCQYASPTTMCHQQPWQNISRRRIQKDALAHAWRRRCLSSSLLRSSFREQVSRLLILGNRSATTSLVRDKQQRKFQIRIQVVRLVFRRWLSAA